MTLGEFLSDRLGRLILCAAAALFGTLFLLATGTQPGAAALLLLPLLLLFAAVQAGDFLRLRARLREMEALLDGLEQKYLFPGCLPPPRDHYERRLFALFQRSGRAMAGAVSDAQAAQRSYREYIESWVHEIKTPLTAAGLICRNIDEAPRRKLAGELAQVEAHVERALFCARAESPERDCVIRQTALADIVSQAVQNHRTLLMQSGVRVETENLDYPVYTDKKWAAFILGQLLQNAARYRGDAPVIVISARSLGRQVQLTVQDNGIGIPAHELPRIFDRGFTGSNGRLRGGSTGMGLYLCRRLAAFLEIDLRVDSEEGRGTRAVIAFPAKEILQGL